MKVIYTEQSIDSLEELLYFSIKEQGLAPEKTASIKDILFNRADSLALNPNKGQ